jgi:hypothetical protein
VGLNANFFSPVSTTPNDPRELIGLAICSNVVVSAFENGRPAVLITRSNQVSFITSALPNYNNVWTAVSGSDRVLINGVAQLQGCTTDFCNQNPRSAVGLSSNGRYFIMLAIDGRQPGWSDGATLYETGQWLARLGAYNGLNLDGGGSTAMAKLENDTAVLLNRPSGGVQRVDGNHIGVFAPPIAPIILAQPQDKVAPVGASVIFTVFSGGTTPLRYQWRFNGTNIAGATSTNLAVSNLQTSNSGYYSVVVTNSAGSAPSSNALLTVTVPFDVTNVVVQARPSSAIITWKTLPASVGRIEYGIVPAFGSTSDIEPSTLSNHTALLIGLLPKTNYNFRIHSIIGSSEIVSGPFTFSTDTSVIVDNQQATYSGNWTLGSSAPDKFGSYYQYAATTSDPAASSQAYYAPAIVTPGKYDVAIWHPQGPNWTVNAPVTIFYNGGAVSTHVNQTLGGGSWQTMATGLDFAAGSGAFVIFGNNTGEPNKTVVVDAIRWSYVASQDNGADGTVPNWWSDYFFGNSVDSMLDPDGDGYTTHDEYILGTNPTNAASRLVVTSQRIGSGLTLAFAPWLGGRVYEMQSATNVNSWQVFTDTPTMADGQGSFAIPNTGQFGARLFRVAVRLAP